MDYKPYSPEWHRKRYLKEALDAYFDDYVEVDTIYTDIMDILNDKMVASLDEYKKLDDLYSRFNA
tara:strand:- start:335 stop:529 length:195 start_codon:yes stop_codon:yes gene_type:complete